MRWAEGVVKERSKGNEGKGGSRKVQEEIIPDNQIWFPNKM